MLVMVVVFGFICALLWAPELKGKHDLEIISTVKAGQCSKTFMNGKSAECVLLKVILLPHFCWFSHRGLQWTSSCSPEKLAYTFFTVGYMRFVANPPKCKQISFCKNRKQFAFGLFFLKRINQEFPIYKSKVYLNATSDIIGRGKWPWRKKKYFF